MLIAALGDQTHDVTDLPPGAPTSGTSAYINKERFGADALRQLWDNRATTACL